MYVTNKDTYMDTNSRTTSYVKPTKNPNFRSLCTGMELTDSRLDQ